MWLCTTCSTCRSGRADDALAELRRPFLDVNGDPTGGNEIRLVRAVEAIRNWWD